MIEIRSRSNGLWIAGCLAACLSGAAWAQPAAAPVAAELDMSGCPFPEAPAVPDGESASDEEMGDAAAAVRNFVTTGQEQLGCLENLQASLGEDITEEQKNTIVDTYNGRVDQLNSVAGAFNDAVRVFKARTPEE